MANKSLFATYAGKLLPKADTRNRQGAPAYSLPAKHAVAQLAVTGTLSRTYYASAKSQLEDVLTVASKVEPRFLAQAAIWARKHGHMKDMPALLLAALSTRDPVLLARAFPRVIDNGRMLRTFVQIMRSGERSVVNAAKLPIHYPTHVHPPEFWEALGRAVASFGFLEEILGRAIFAFTATREMSDQDLEAECKTWLITIEKALYDPLGDLIQSYGKAVRENANTTITNLDELLADLRKAAVLRNVLCHGSWRTPDEHGFSVPFFVNKNKQVFDTHIGVEFLANLQRHVAELSCCVVSTVTHAGWRFPGSSGPGKVIG